MVASVGSGNLQPFRLEPRGSADDPVTHNSEWNSSALDILPCLHVWLATRMRVAMALDSQAHATMKCHD